MWIFEGDTGITPETTAPAPSELGRLAVLLGFRRKYPVSFVARIVGSRRGEAIRGVGALNGAGL